MARNVVVGQAAAPASSMEAATASGPCAAAGSIHITCQPWPSRSKKLREYMKPWSSASSASEPPAASAAALTVSTSSRDDTLKQYSASVCVVGSAIGSFANSANSLEVRYGNVHEQHAARVGGNAHGESPVGGAIAYVLVDRPGGRNSSADPGYAPAAIARFRTFMFPVAHWRVKVNPEIRQPPGVRLSW
jgi:hypothetical protein